MEILCPDENVLRQILESGRLRKMPVQVRSGGVERKITIFEDPHHEKQRKNRPFEPSSAKDLCYLNDCYLRFRNEATTWLDSDDIASIAAKHGVSEQWKRPRLMFYVNGELHGIVLSRKIRPLSDAIKAEIAEKFELNRCIEVVIE